MEKEIRAEEMCSRHFFMNNFLSTSATEMPTQAYESHKTHISQNRQTNRDQLMNFPRHVIVLLTHIFIICFSLSLLVVVASVARTL